MVIQVGENVGRWEVLEGAGFRGKKRRRQWKCKCKCGTVKIVLDQSLKSGLSKSCGCIARDQRPKSYRHGYYNHKLYSVWSSMLQRCCNPKDKGFSNYGGRGIKVCDEWKDSKNFIFWALNNGWKEGLELDRKENDDNYSPDNCRFVTKTVNNRNTRRSKIIEFNGVKKSLPDWAEEVGISRHALTNRLKRGWTLERALSR